MQIQLARDTVLSENVMLSANFVAFASSSKIFKLFGDHVAAASTLPDNIADTIPDASISIASISSIVNPTLVSLQGYLHWMFLKSKQPVFLLSLR